MSHRKLTHISIYVLLTLLLSSLASAATWDPLGLISVIPDDGVNAGDYFLKIHNVDPYEHIVTFTIKYKGQVIDQAYVTPEESYILDNKILIDLVDFAETYRYGPQARLRVFSWADGVILNANAPHEFQIDNKYNVCKFPVGHIYTSF